MAYYRGRGRYDPRADERREREAKDQTRIELGRKKLHRLLAQYRLVPLKGDAAQRAWGATQVRTYSTGKTSSGDWITATIRKEGRTLYLQRAGSGLGWSFYRLDPRFHVPREDEHPERDARRRRRARR